MPQEAKDTAVEKSTALIDWSVFTNLDFHTVLHNYLIPWAGHLFTAFVIFYIGRRVGVYLTRIIMRALTRTHTDPILVNFLNTLLNAVFFLIVSILALSQLGLDTTSLVALIGAAGIAIGLALKDSLSNFASGVMLILFRPFNLGDSMQINGIEGTVDQITIFSTRLKTGDNKVVIIPNSSVYGNTLINFSRETNRRIDLMVGISYESDLLKAKRILREILDSNDKVLPEPVARIAVSELADSSVNLVVRPWVRTPDYWDVRFDLLEKIKLRFDDEGIDIPYPQMSLHVGQVNSSTPPTTFI